MKKSTVITWILVLLLAAYSLNCSYVIDTSSNESSASPDESFLKSPRTYNVNSHLEERSKNGEANKEFDILHYDINVTIYPDTHSLNGIAILTINFLENISDVKLALALPPYNVSLINNTELDYYYLEYTKSIQIYSDGLFLGGTSAEIVVKYTGIVNDEWNYIGPEGSYTLHDEWWYPAFPKNYFDMDYDRATANISITVPNGQTAVSSGTLAEWNTPSTGNWTYVWQVTTPAVFLNFAVGTFETLYFDLNGMNVSAYLYPDHYHLASGILNESVKIIDYYSTIFSPYPYPKFAIVEIPDKFQGGMGLQSFIALGSSVLNRTNISTMLSHEIAHNWWGHLIPGRGTDCAWLHEGFASYSSVLYEEYQSGSRHVLNWAKTYYLNNESGSGEQTLAEGWARYTKGPWVLHMLRYLVNDSMFFKIMKGFVNEYKFSEGARISDFQQVAESEYGQNLSWFFDQWIYQVRHLNYSIEEAISYKLSNESYLTKLRIHRNGSAVMPVDIGFNLTTGKQIVLEKAINGTQINSTIDLVTNELVQNVTLDPRGWLLAEFNQIDVAYEEKEIDLPIIIFLFFAINIAVWAVLADLSMKRRKNA